MATDCAAKGQCGSLMWGGCTPADQMSSIHHDMTGKQGLGVIQYLVDASSQSQSGLLLIFLEKRHL